MVWNQQLIGWYVHIELHISTPPTRSRVVVDSVYHSTTGSQRVKQLLFHAPSHLFAIHYIVMTTTTNARLVPGRTRICDKAGYRGTVVYVGPVASATDNTQIYAGIVWDDPDRGKHDGTVLCRQSKQLVRHFTATHVTAGSFVPFEKLHLGVCLTIALLRSKYVALDSDECVAPNNILPHTAQTTSGKNDKPIEFWGELKLRPRQQLEDLTNISLRLAGISSIAIDPDWQRLQHNLREVDLAGNLLWQWDQVWILLRQLPQLTKLSLACNHMGDPTDWDITIDSMYQHSTLKHLNLNECGLHSTRSLFQIGKAFPALDELILANNTTQNPKFQLDVDSTIAQQTIKVNNSTVTEVDVVTQLASLFPNLTKIDCSNCTGLFAPNDIVEAWSQLSHLKWLSLDDNKDVIQFTNNRKDHKEKETNLFYPALQHLQLAGTGIAFWKDLQLPPSVTSLRWRHCPLQVRRTEVIAHFGIQLQQLNSSIIAEPERREAARWCLRHGSITDEFDARTMEYWKVCYPELASLTSNHSPTSSAAFSSVSQHLTVLNVTIRSLLADSCTRDPLIRRLPALLTIQKLKALCARQFSLDADLQTLYYCDSSSRLPVPLDDDLSTLADCGVPDGANIYVNEREIPSINRLQDDEMDSKIQKQERELLDFQERQKLSHNM